MKKEKSRKSEHIARCIINAIWQSIRVILIMFCIENLIYAFFAETFLGKLFPMAFYISCIICVIVTLCINAIKEVCSYRQKIE